MNLAAQLRNRVGRPVVGKGRFSVTFDEADGLKRAVQTLEPLHYSDGGDLKDIDTAWIGQDGEMVIQDAAFTARASLDLQAKRVLEISSQGLGIGFKPLPLYYANASSKLLLPNTMQRLVAPQNVRAAVRDDTLLWDGAYGDGTLLEWRATPTGVQKWLTLDSASRLPASTLGGKSKLKSLANDDISLVLGFALTMPGLRAAAKHGLLDLTDIEVEGGVSLLGPDDTPVLALQRPLAVDAEGNTVAGTLKFQKFGPSLVVAAAFPMSWLQDAVYPVRIDPTVTSEQTDLANDGWVNQGGFSSGTIYVGTRTSSDWGYQSFIRWLDSPVPKGATISSDIVSLNHADVRGAAINIAIEYEAVDSAAQIAGYDDFVARTRTAKAAIWAVDTATGRKTTPNLKTGLQAVVNRSGYSVGSAVQMFFRDNLENNTGTVNRVRFSSSEDGSGLAPTRETLYSEPVSTLSETTVYLRPRSTVDDGYSYSPDGYAATSYGVFGDINSDHYDYRTFVRCTLDAGQTLPQGVKIKKAEAIIRAYGGARTGGDVARLSLQPADNPTAPGSKGDHDGRTRGTQASLNTGGIWDGAGQSEYSTDMTTQVQTIVNRAGYNSGAMLLLIDGAGGGYGGQNNNSQFHSYDTEPAKAPYLKVTYASAAPPTLLTSVRPY